MGCGGKRCLGTARSVVQQQPNGKPTCACARKSGAWGYNQVRQRRMAEQWGYGAVRQEGRSVSKAVCTSRWCRSRRVFAAMRQYNAQAAHTCKPNVRASRYQRSRGVAARREGEMSAAAVRKMGGRRRAAVAVRYASLNAAGRSNATAVPVGRYSVGRLCRAVCCVCAVRW